MKVPSLLLLLLTRVINVKLALEEAMRVQGGVDGGWMVNATPRPLYLRERPRTR